MKPFKLVPGYRLETIHITHEDLVAMVRRRNRLAAVLEGRQRQEQHLEEKIRVFERLMKEEAK